jgi:hypothetical protein
MPGLGDPVGAIQNKNAAPEYCQACPPFVEASRDRGLSINLVHPTSIHVNAGGRRTEY